MKQAIRELRQFNEFEILAALYQKGLESEKDCSGGIWVLSKAFEGAALNDLISAGAVQYNDTCTKISLTEFGVGMAFSGAVEIDISGKQMKAKSGSILNLALVSIINQDPGKFMSYL
jgi:hypothetical protein